MLKFDRFMYEEQDEGKGGDNDGLQGQEGNGQEEVTITKEELAKRLDQEAERRVAKARDGWQSDLDAKLEEAKSEGAKLAKMSAAEKAKAEEEQRMSELEKREAEINKRELTANVKDVLADKGLPSELASVLVELGDADAITKATDNIATIIDQRVNEQVDKKLSGSGKPRGESSDTDTRSDLAKGLGL
ncbi:DUF4355 domain-containing protein [Convivina intestini]|uniref:Uncharacterized protein DUF4355 n=1 Tax=Convivina intestini TaxID=1505726 RepID=A0A2U1D4F1_9LACO|nr:DUF4355 domain-containing protein [Convivina intestini]PVY82551.1 uncharacterized protein DUF4355 [Convivina intestini]SDC16848.1 protein of unknown function [Leuconostocaceae bacterium R-53105]